MERRKFMEALAASIGAVAFSTVQLGVETPVDPLPPPPPGFLMQYDDQDHAWVWVKAGGHIKPGQLVSWHDREALTVLPAESHDFLGVAENHAQKDQPVKVTVYGKTEVRYEADSR